MNNVFLLLFLSFYFSSCDNKDQSGHQETGISLSISCNMFSGYQMLLNLQPWAFKCPFSSLLAHIYFLSICSKVWLTSSEIFGGVPGTLGSFVPWRDWRWLEEETIVQKQVQELHWLSSDLYLPWSLKWCRRLQSDWRRSRPASGRGRSKAGSLRGWLAAGWRSPACTCLQHTDTLLWCKIKKLRAKLKKQTSIMTRLIVANQCHPTFF